MISGAVTEGDGGSADLGVRGSTAADRSRYAATRSTTLLSGTRGGGGTMPT